MEAERAIDVGLLERTTELEQVLEAAEGARGGAGRMVTIIGPLGIGKTRLLGEVTVSARQLGTRPLTALASELEQDFPFGVARQLVEPALATAGRSERTELLSGAAALAEDVILGTPAEGRPTADPSFAALHGLYWLVANLAAREPLLLAVDDAHWADAASLRWLSYLSRRLEGLAVLLVLCWRPDEPGENLRLLGELETSAASGVVRPAPLSLDAAGQLLEGAHGKAPDAAFVRACHDVTGGNPYLLGELTAMAASEGLAPTAANAERVRRVGPENVSRSVLARVARLGSAAMTLARAVAVLEGSAELRHLVAVSGLPEAEVAHAADALARAGIIRGERPLAFQHPILRAAVYADMGPLERAAQHARAAAVLAEAGSPAAAVAAHLVATEPAGDSRKVELLRVAARDAFVRGAPEAARTFLARALAEPPAEELHSEVLHELGLAGMQSGQPEAVEHLSEAIELAGDHRTRALRAPALAQTLVLLGRGEDAVERLARVVDDLPDHERDLGIELEAHLHVSGFVSLGARRLVLSRQPRFTGDPHERSGLPLAAAALESSLSSGSASEAEALAEQALGGGRLLAATGADSPPFYMAANALLYADRLERAYAVYTDALDDARPRGSIQGFGSAICWRSLASYRRGALAEAQADARLYMETASHAVPIGLPLAASVLVEAALDREGDLDAAEGLAKAHAAGLSPDFALGLFLIETRARLRLRRADAAGALADFEECGELEASWGFENPALTSWRVGVALAQLALGEREDAQACADAALAQARRFGARRPLGMALRAAGLTADGDESLDLLRESTRVLEQSEARLEHARSLLELGAALRRAGRRSAAREPLNAAMAEARRCEATALAEAAYEELLASGARPRKIIRTGVDALTASERRIAEMARGGMSNREIAQTLFVTVRTVEVHLRHVYQKLDISSRGELEQALGGDVAAISSPH